MTYKKITIGLVTCKRDFEIAKRMINSLVRYTNYSQIEEIIVVWNESFDNDENANFFQVLSKFLEETLHKKINFRLFSSDNLLEKQENYTPATFHVWQGQQYIKLRIGDICNTEWLLIHDSKDYYYNNIDYQLFFNETGKAKQIIHSIVPAEIEENSIKAVQSETTYGNVFLYAWTVTAKIWHNHNLLMNEKYTGNKYNSIPMDKTLTETPYFFHVPTLKKMNAECDKILGGFYPLLFFCFVPDNQVPMFTEFYHYSNFVEQTQGGLKTLYEPSPPNLWKTYIQQSKT